ncbi:60S ribosomal export protein NMD3 [Halocatena marina]|uniref:60S ribosomal export protein NMD3 n=1 Tax=Halocatena marina TaxID=2934937 RepID=A0ABD5YXP9_9EURY|nr:60S ribosomal export protein NMD3 [Halocatena marina]
MADKITVTGLPRCLNCGFEAPLDGGEWNSAEVPPLGDLTRCPECGSTNIRGQW